MAKKKETKKVELKEVSRKEINGAIIITYEDGSVKIIPAPIMLSAEEAKDFFASEEEVLAHFLTLPVRRRALGGPDFIKTLWLME